MSKEHGQSGVKPGRDRLSHGFPSCDTLSDMPQRDVQRSFRLPADLNAKLEAKAQALDRSASWVIVRAIEVALLGENQAQVRALQRGLTHRRTVGKHYSSSGKLTYHARCSCGWRGATRHTRTDARDDIPKHTWDRG